ncbi:hypothetical protein EVAR_39262_1 [Eumeta japonica]|uniref:Uncharacterized protein n=1 Tax=Eumeta variegata TaxID=151549 RepID=A0A4C1Y0M9_EUMVA|nr:hypothetical protein EVAR_39262_1 [Eumeta japonica]
MIPALRHTAAGEGLSEIGDMLLSLRNALALNWSRTTDLESIFRTGWSITLALGMHTIGTTVYVHTRRERRLPVRRTRIFEKKTFVTF